MKLFKSGKMEEDVFQILNYAFFTMMLLLCLYPFYYIFLYSLSDATLASKETITIYPLGITIKNYIEVFKLKGLFLAFIVSASRTVTGTAVTLFFTGMMAYTLTKSELAGRKIFYRISVSSMYLNAGLIPWYLTMRSLHMKDNFFVYILPGAVSVFSMILIKTYIEQLSPALEESALIDGAGYFTIFLRIIIPVCKPVIAAVAVFSAVNQWNQWFDNFFLVKNSNLRTLQLVLYEYLTQNQAIAEAAAREGGSMGGVVRYAITPFTIRMTVTMVVTIPVLLVYPAIQKYFVRGIMLGAVKG